jgi:xylulokinase
VIIAVDVGTQSLKVVAVRDDLSVAGEGSVAYQVEHPRPGWAQQDPMIWEAALAPAIATALRSAGAAPDAVIGLAIAGQLDGCVAVDASGQPLGPCLIWMDRRASACLPPLSPESFRRVTGQVADASHMAAKIRWLMKNAIGLDGARFHQPVSYLVERLTGESVFDHGLASTTMLYDLEARALSAELLDAFEISASALPRIADATDVAGRISRDGASLCGLPAGIPVAVGTGDDFATPLGAGVIAPGPAVCVIGTAEVVGALSSDRLIDDDGLVETHGYVNDCYFVENPGWLSGGAMTWLCELIGVPSFAALDALAASVAPGAGGVSFLPTLSGAMAPVWNPSATGSITGLSPAHSNAHLARAAMEGCAFAMRDVIDRLAAIGVPIDSVLLLGGGSRSDVWAQIRADALGRSVDVAARADTCPVGAAMIAAVACGVASDLSSCARAVAGSRRRVEPVSSHRDAMDSGHAAYRDHYRRMFG